MAKSPPKKTTDNSEDRWDFEIKKEDGSFYTFYFNEKECFLNGGYFGKITFLNSKINPKRILVEPNDKAAHPDVISFNIDP